MNPVPHSKIRLRNAGDIAFTLIELLVVIGIMVALTALTIPAFNSIKGSGDLKKSSYEFAETLEQARNYAIAKNTYVWVGIVEEDAGKPTVSGTGRIVLSVIASQDNTNLLSGPGSIVSGTNAAQVSKLRKLENMHLATISGTAFPRTSGTAPANPCQIADQAFINSKGLAFGYPLGGNQYTFSKIIQFSPIGDASRLGDSPARWMEIGLRPCHGNVADLATSNVIAIQIAGIGGQIIINRP